MSVHICPIYDDHCICSRCNCDVEEFPKCKTCGKDKGMML